MNGVLFALYVVACALVVGLQLLLTIREWRRLAQRQPTSIDQVYVRLERYFGLAFRAKLHEWINAAPAEPSEDAVGVIAKHRERIQLHREVSFPEQTNSDDIIVAETMTCGAGSHLSREVYTRSHCRVGAGSRLQALAADGDVLLGRSSEVMRWLDASGELVVEPDCRILGRVTSSSRVLLLPGARAKSICAPLVRTYPFENGIEKMELHVDSVSPVSLGLDDDGAWRSAGADPARIRPMSDDCVLYDGDLTTLGSVDIPCNLIVRGHLVVGQGSQLRGDVKATRSIRVGPMTTCFGNLVAGQHVHLGMGVTFHGMVFAEGGVQICRHVRGERPDPGVAVYGATTVVLGPDVEIHGKVSAGSHVLIAAA